MIKLQVKSIWQNNAAIRDKYVAEARTSQQGIQITYKKEVMTVEYEDLERRIAFKSKKPFFDRFSRSAHFLYYFQWRPDGTLPVVPKAEPKLALPEQKSLF